MIMLSVVISVRMCGWEGEKKRIMGDEQGDSNAVDSEHGASKGRGSHIPTKSQHSK